MHKYNFKLQNTKEKRKKKKSERNWNDVVSSLQVKVWFQNRRMKWRHTKESESAALSNLDSQKDSSRKLGKDNAKSEKTASEDEEDIEIEVDV